MKIHITSFSNWNYSTAVKKKNSHDILSVMIIVLEKPV